VKGRRALAAWLQQPGAGPVLEFEQLLKISFADSGTKADIISCLDATRAWVLDQNEENLATARAYLEGRGAFPQRASLNHLAGRFLTDFYVTVAQWVQWASATVADWPDDVRQAPFDAAAVAEAVRLAESIPLSFRPPAAIDTVSLRAAGNSTNDDCTPTITLRADYPCYFACASPLGYSHDLLSFGLLADIVNCRIWCVRPDKTLRRPAEAQLRQACRLAAASRSLSPYAPEVDVGLHEPRASR